MAAEGLAAGSSNNLDDTTLRMIVGSSRVLAELELPCGDGFTARTFPKLRSRVRIPFPALIGRSQSASCRRGCVFSDAVKVNYDHTCSNLGPRLPPRIIVRAGGGNRTSAEL